MVSLETLFKTWASTFLQTTKIAIIAPTNHGTTKQASPHLLDQAPTTLQICQEYLVLDYPDKKEKMGANIL